jgi:hypothetical protein
MPIPGILDRMKMFDKFSRRKAEDLAFQDLCEAYNFINTMQHEKAPASAEAL